MVRTGCAATAPSEITLGRTPEERAPVLRSVYDVAFGYRGGDIAAADSPPARATSDLLRLVFSYRGSIMYKMQAGMGDAVFAPLYEVLKQPRRPLRVLPRGHRPAPAGRATGRCDAIDSRATRRSSRPGSPSTTRSSGVKGLPCWPSEPLWDQLEPAAEGVNFEARAEPAAARPHTLERSANHDFDEVVLGIPVGALEPICGQLIAHDARFAAGIDTAVTVQTQAFQLWADRAATELGWEHDPNSVAGCYVEPLDTYCDMSHLIPRESWAPDDSVKTIAYFCGVLDEVEDETPAEATERVKRNAIDFIENDMATLWPQARRRTARSTGACSSTGRRQRGRALRLPVLARERHPQRALRADPGGIGQAPPAVRRVAASRTSRWPATGPVTESTAAASRPR